MIFIFTEKTAKNNFLIINQKPKKRMKNLTKIFAVIAAGLFAFSCVTDSTEDLGVNIDNNGSASLTVSLEGTKTQLGEKDADGKYPLYWSEGDQIAINGQASAALSANYDGAATATFQFAEPLTTPYCVVYPAAEGAGEGTTYPINFLAEQPYTEGTFASGAAPLYGYAAEAGTVQLNHLTGVLRLAVKGNGEALTSVVIKSEIGKIAGPFTVNCTDGALSALEGASNEVTVTFAEPLVLGAEATPIYAAVPAGSYGTFSITLHTANDKMTVKFNSSVKPILVGAVREFTEFTYAANDVESGGTLFEIDGKDALIEFANMVSTGTFAPYSAAQVVANIDMTGVEWTPIEGFDGFTFDGGSASGYAINGLTAPLFGTTTSTISNVKLTNVNIASNGRAVLGAVACKIVAVDTQLSITNCYVSGTITISNPDLVFSSEENLYNATNFGGVVGYLGGAAIDNCVNEANITVNQVASSSNTAAVHPSVGGVVGRAHVSGEILSPISNCVNGNNAKTTGIIKYQDNCATQLYIPHVGGVLGLGSSDNAAIISDCSNYGAISFNANAAGGGGISYESTTIGGVAATTYSTIRDNNNYGTITVEKGNIKALFVGGVTGTAKNSSFSNSHNHTGANIWVKEPVRNFGITVGGVVAGTTYVNKAATDIVENCTNDGSITIEASTDSAVTLDDSRLYRIGGVLGYINKTIANCENKANGDITISGNIILSRNNAQSGFNVAGVYAYSSTVGDHTGNINRGDINVYTNVSKNSAAKADETTYYRLDIGGVVAHTQRPPVGKEENFGHITIGKADGTAMSISANGIYIGGITGQRYSRGIGTNASGNNSGHITINKGVTLNTNGIGLFIGGCSAYNATSTTYNNYCNSGKITVAGSTDGLAYIGGVGGCVTGSLNGCNNTGDVTVSATTGGGTCVGGGAGYSTGSITSSSNSGAVSVSSTTTGTTYVGGYIGYNIGEAEFSGVSNTGDVTFSGNSGNNTLALGGMIGANNNACAFTNCSNNGVVTLTKDAKAQKVHYVGGLIGYSVASSSYTSCTNSTKQGVEWGIVIHQTASTTGGGCAKRIGGVIGLAGATTLTDVSNSAGIYHDGYQLGTAGLSIGGIGGTMGVTTVNGTIKNSGNIYYAGRCPKSNFGIAGIFATPGSSELTGATIINTGNITVEKKFDDFIPTDNGSHRCVLGGITGYAAKSLQNATSYCTISILNWRTASGTAENKNLFGMIQGIETPTNHITNCKVGGEIRMEKTGEEWNNPYEEDYKVDTYSPGELNVSNYATYIIGGEAMTASDAKSQNIGVISSADDTTPEYAN